MQGQCGRAVCSLMRGQGRSGPGKMEPPGHFWEGRAWWGGCSPGQGAGQAGTWVGGETARRGAAGREWGHGGNRLGEAGNRVGLAEHGKRLASSPGLLCGSARGPQELC